MMLQTQSRGDVRLLLLLVTMFVLATIFLSPHGVANASGAGSSKWSILGATNSQFRNDGTISDTLYKKLCSSSFYQLVNTRLQEHNATINGQVSASSFGGGEVTNARPHQGNFYK